MKKKTKKLSLEDVRPGNWVVQVEPDSHKRRFFFVTNVIGIRIHGFYLEDLINNPFEMLETQSKKKDRLFLDSELLLLQPTRKRIEKIKEKLRRQIKETALLMDSTIEDMNPVKKYGAYFMDKSAFQKDDCITGCGAKSVQEAVCYHSANETSRVRCCKKPTCEKSAAKLAKSYVNLQKT